MVHGSLARRPTLTVMLTGVGRKLGRVRVLYLDLCLNADRPVKGKQHLYLILTNLQIPLHENIIVGVKMYE